MTAEQLTAKVESLAGRSLVGVLDDPAEPTKMLLEATRLA
jgi:hypothetical protein